MHEFDSYISSILDNLKINKKKKTELTHEFRDHLELLKTEFLNNGLTDEEAKEKAIESFGETNSLKKILNASMSTFRSLSNTLFGLLIVLISIAFSYIPLFGVVTAFNDYRSGTEIMAVNFYQKQTIIQALLFFITFGYFIPFVFNKLHGLVQLAIAYSLLGVLVGFCLSFALTGILSAGFIFVFFITGLIGGFSGYIILLGVNRLSILSGNRSFRSVN